MAMMAAVVRARGGRARRGTRLLSFIVVSSGMGGGCGLALLGAARSPAALQS